MVKIIGILAIVLVCYCEINAEIDNMQNGKSTAEGARKRYTTKKPHLAANVSDDVNTNQTDDAQPRAKFATGFLEDFGGPLVKLVIKIGEAPYNDLEQLFETRRTNQLHRDEGINQIENKVSQSNKSKKKRKHYRRSKKHKDMDEVDYKDNIHQKNKTRIEEEDENEKRNSESNKHKKKKKHHHHSKKHEDIGYKDKHEKDKKSYKTVEENESESNEPKKKKHHHELKKHDDKIHQKEKKHDIDFEENEEKERKRNRPKRKKKHHHNYEKYKDIKEDDYKDKIHQKDKKRETDNEENTENESERHHEPTKKKKHHHNSKKHEDVDYKDKKRDKPVEENEEKESESNEPKKKKKHNRHSKKRKYINETDYKDVKHRKHKKRHREGHKTVKKIKVRNSLEKKYKHTEKRKDRDNRTNTNVTVNDIKQSAAEMEDMRLANVSAAASQEQSLAIASSTTPKPQPKPVQPGVVGRTLFKNIMALRAHKKKDENEIRATRMVPLYLNNKDVKKLYEEHGRQGSHKKSEKQKNPLHLSPYAIMAQMEELMNEFPKVNATISKIARTVEYNDIILVKVTEKKQSAERYLRAKESKYAEDVPEKKIIFIVHGLTVMGMKGTMSLVQMSELKLLVTYYLKHINKFDIYFMPLANPDGYSASRSSDHTIWNKNVSPQSECPGVFVDRNFDVAWNGTREISSCSQLYPGAKPFSEVESRAVRDVFHHYSHKILAYIHVHSGTFDEKVFKGDAILFPRGYTEMQSDDDKYIDLKGEVDEAMKNASFRVMSVTVDTLANWYGIVAGSSVDYASAVFGIPYALEFVMQIYDTPNLNNNALTEIWSRLIDTTFNNMWKSLHRASAERT